MYPSTNRKNSPLRAAGPDQRPRALGADEHLQLPEPDPGVHGLLAGVGNLPGPQPVRSGRQWNRYSLLDRSRPANLCLVPFLVGGNKVLKPARLSGPAIRLTRLLGIPGRSRLGSFIWSFSVRAGLS